MNTALYILNALALVALVSFQMQSQARDPALITVQTEQLVAHPVAQWAVMGPERGQAAFLAADRSAVDSIEQPTPVHRTERFTF